MAEALVINGQPDEALELIHSHVDSEETRPFINTVTYTTVLKGFAMARRAKDVFSTYEEMKHRGISLNTVTFNTMLDACAKCNAMHRASSLVEEMRQAAVELDLITYSTLVKGYCCEGDIDRALRVMEEMKSLESFAPDEIMYNSLLDGCAKKQLVDEGLRLLDEMREARIAPSNYTLSIMVKLLGNARRLDQAFQLVEDLSSQNGFRPNVQVYTCLTQACVMNRRLDRALQLHDRMVADTRCVIDEKFYSVLVRGCLQQRQLGTAVDVVRAAYHLPGGALSSRPRPVGMEPRTLEELVRKLKAAGQEESNALPQLATDLRQHRGVDLYNVPSTQGGVLPSRGHGRGH
jgi:pentatricopeptide repeat protein